MKKPIFIAGVSAFVVMLNGCGSSSGSDSSSQAPSVSAASECEADGCTLIENITAAEIVVGDSPINLLRNGSITLTTGN